MVLEPGKSQIKVSATREDLHAVSFHDRRKRGNPTGGQFAVLSNSFLQELTYPTTTTYSITNPFCNNPCPVVINSHPIVSKNLTLTITSPPEITNPVIIDPNNSFLKQSLRVRIRSHDCIPLNNPLILQHVCTGIPSISLGFADISSVCFSCLYLAKTNHNC